MSLKHKRTVNYKEKGITLIALVVTIIVLLILAGVTIRLALDNNGIIGRARNSKVVWDNSTANELELVGQMESDIDTLSGTNASTGNILKVGETDLSTVEDLSTLYGQETDYQSTLHPSIKWQLFYADSNNYYVIASDYVPNSELPCENVKIGDITYGSTDLVKSTSSTFQHSTYCARFASSSSYNDYVMTSTTEHRKGSQANTLKAGSEKRNPLVETYLKWVAAYPNGSNVNICAVAYMMDTEKWSSFADGAANAYAIGGPTLEMFVKSYNESKVSTHTNKLIGYDDTSDTSKWNSTGYKVKTEKDSSWKDYGANGDLDTTNATGDTGGNMWVRSSNTKAYGCYLAAPSSNDSSGLKRVDDFGYLTNGSTSTTCYGFRPLVSIPRS